MGYQISHVIILCLFWHSAFFKIWHGESFHNPSEAKLTQSSCPKLLGSPKFSEIETRLSGMERRRDHHKV